MPTCARCNTKVGLLQFDHATGMCRACTKAARASDEAIALEREIATASDRLAAGDPQPLRDLSGEALRRLSAGIIVTTAFTVPNREISETIDIVTAEVALGMNVLRDIASTWRDFVGGRGRSLQGVLREARTSCLDELRQEAFRAGADAVIGVDLDYSEIMSGAMIFVVASGTAVKLD